MLETGSRKLEAGSWAVIHHSSIRRFEVLMTDLLYQTDSYLREFDATVVAVDAEAGRVWRWIARRSTPAGAGQPGDVGQR